MARRKTKHELKVQKTLGRNVRFLRKSKGWSLAELAFQMTENGAPITATIVGSMESGNRPTTVSELVVLCELFDRRYGDVVGRRVGQ